MTDYQIKFAPELEISPEDFVAAWNEMPDCRAVAEARIESSADNYDPLSIAIAILSGIGLGVAANIVYDRLKEMVQKLSTKKDELENTQLLDIKEIPLPDGSKLLVLLVKQNEN